MENILDKLYHYKAKVGRVIDGDTFTLEEIDLGFGFIKRSTKEEEIKVRMLGINTRELKSTNKTDKKLAFQAKDYMTGRLKKGTEVIIQSTGFDVFGRVLAVVYLGDECLNETLLGNGMAVVYEDK
jgi:micrococcal nuclease